jgi:uncharacterized protein (DUF302 family)
MQASRRTFNPTRAELQMLRIVLVLALVAGSVHAGQAQEALVIHSKRAAFDDVKFELQNAIVGRGLTVETNGDVAGMLARTGADIGSTAAIYRQAEYFAFCSAKLSRAAMQADPANLGFCPYVVFIYETAAAPGTTHVGYRRLPAQGSEASRAALAEVAALLDGIVQDALK